MIELSDSFGAVWPDVAGELGAAARTVHADDVVPGAAALIVAAGGEEQRGLDAIEDARRFGAPVFLVGASVSHRIAVEALRRGAADYFALPDDLAILRRTLGAALEAHAGGGTPSTDGAFAALIGASTALRTVLDRARRVLEHRDVTVLIGGETGTGKELLALGLHHGGPRAGGPFVPVNCAAIPAQLLESELFGHERGAFTDARDAKPGLFEAADGGTLFLDEIGHMPLALQGKVLRALETREVRRVGATRDRTVDVRFIAATHVDLRQSVARGEFREDLYYRLNVIPLELPPLRKRPGDILLLARHFLAASAERYGLPAPPIDAAAQDVLRRHSWPGNVRELRHAIERALLLSPPGTLDFGELLPGTGPATGGGTIPEGTLAEIEVAAVRATLAATDDNKSEAARRLGISRTRLLRILARGDDS